MVGKRLSCLRFFSLRIGFESRPGHCKPPLLRIPNVMVKEINLIGAIKVPADDLGRNQDSNRARRQHLFGAIVPDSAPARYRSDHCCLARSPWQRCCRPVVSGLP